MNVSKLLVLVLSVLPMSCSLVTDFTECGADSDCAVGGTCVDAICIEAGRVSVTSHVVQDTTWTADKIWVLENLIMVVPPATLTIEPGTKILGRFNTGLASLAGAKVIADGTREKPIVFTSDKPVGQRLAGDWAGIALVGKAKVNRDPFNLRITTDEYDTAVGGGDDTWNCGTLRYVRVEFGGSEVDGKKALKGVTLAGCGSETIVDYVQTHMSDDDGIGIFGGTVNLRHVVATRARDDGLDFDTGWRGTAQFVAIQQDLLGVEALELENLAEDPSALPQTTISLYNFTLIGANGEGDRQVGIYYKNGGLGTVSHGIVMGHKTASIYVGGPEAVAHAEGGKAIVKNTLFFDAGADGEGYFDRIDGLGGGLTDYSMFQETSLNNVFGVDPGFEGDPYDLNNPGWVPSSANTTGIEPPPAGFDPTAVYRGAFAPGAVPWTEGWTSYPRS